jgi:hypothetical protein
MSKGLSLARAKVANHTETEPDASESPSKEGADFEPEHHSPKYSEVLSHAIPELSACSLELNAVSPVGYLAFLRRNKQGDNIPLL